MEGKWTKIGSIFAIVGVIAAIIIAIVQNENSKQEARMAQIEEDRRLREAAKIVEDQHNAEMLVKQGARVQEWRSDIENAESNHHYRIELEQNCEDELFIAIHYRDLLNNWVTQGWWRLEAGEAEILNIKTNNKIIYFYSTRVEYDDDVGIEYYDITDESFVHLTDFPLFGKNVYKAKFFGVDFDVDDKNVLSYDFSCK